jgi:GH24 family phage-related lysozyme (muramidase)
VRRCNEAGRQLIKRFEGCRLEAYQCAAGVWTLGYGSTGGVRPGDTITQAQAEARFEADVARFEGAVDVLTQGLGLSDNAFSALVSLAFNVGAFRIARSTLLRKLRAGDTLGAADQFLLWARAGGAVLPGLARRRAAERVLFLTP